MTVVSEDAIYREAVGSAPKQSMLSEIESLAKEIDQMLDEMRMEKLRRRDQLVDRRNEHLKAAEILSNSIERIERDVTSSGVTPSPWPREQG